MNRAVAPLALLLAASVTGIERPRVSRAALEDIEKGFDRRVERAVIENPFYLLGATRGVYLEGYGAVFTAELNLITAPALSPFRPPFSKEEIQSVRLKKLERLDLLKRVMREMLVASAVALQAVPPDEHIAVAVSLFYYRSWEDTTGLPSRILMQAQRKVLLDFQAGRIKEEALAAAIHVEEL